MTKPPTSESSAAAGAVLPMTYDYWRDGICGAGPNAANIVAYNGEDVRPIARVENDLDREAIIRKHNNIVRRLSTQQPPPEATAIWRCTQCGEVLNYNDSAWRWTGVIWQHHHANVGHVDARHFPPEAGSVGVPEGFDFGRCLMSAYGLCPTAILGQPARFRWMGEYVRKQLKLAAAPAPKESP